MPTAAALSEIYASFWSREAGWANGDDHAEKVIFDRPERLARHLRRELARHLSGNAIRILDFGGGDGTLATMLGNDLLAAGLFDRVHITVVDMNRRPTEALGKLSIEHRPTLDDTPDPTYDFVMASAVLEHLPRPAAVMRSLLELLKPGGIFYARTPFVRPLVRVLPLARARNHLFPYPLHLHDMGQEFWENVLRTLSMEGTFEIVRSRPSIVEGTLTRTFVRALASHLLKAPWWLFGRRYSLVGSWEIFIRKSPPPPS